jgi:HD-GYP domain-containing protein (c-di-GMP phosphodiesterase class II)
LIGVNRLYQANIAMQHLSRELLELMVSAIEARDPYTSGHSRRVAAMAVVIARAVGLSNRDVKRIEVAGLLHDVGKIHEKYAAVLRKPDRLTKDEWLLMKQHPADGEALVAKVSQLHDILPAVRHHHERWDGSGYPDGIAGDVIPLAARILTIADTIDAMTSDRPYRRALTKDEVSSELVKWAGKQFDPEITAKLLASPHWDSLFTAATTEETRFGLRLVIAHATRA